MRNGTLAWEDGYRESKVENKLLGGEILPNGCTQVTSNIYSIEGAAVEELGSMLRTSYVLKNSGHEE